MISPLDGPALSDLPELICRRFAAAPVPDGNLEKPPWVGVERVRFDHDWAGHRHAGAVTEVAAIWTPSHIHFAFWCAYEQLHVFENEDPAAERWELWTRDVVEVFVNPRPAQATRYFEFEVAPNNQWIDLAIDRGCTPPLHDAAWDSGFDHATRVEPDSRRWTCELRVPLRSLGVEGAEPGAPWRANFYRADGGGNGEPRRYLAWSPTATPTPNFHVPERFGWLRLA